MVLPNKYFISLRAEFNMGSFPNGSEWILTVLSTGMEMFQFTHAENLVFSLPLEPKSFISL